jgi:isopenicillin N synthase-like dioxygenase
MQPQPSFYSAHTLAAATLPVIDVSGLRSTNSSARAAVADQLRAACLDKGFFYIREHSIPEDLIAGAFDATRRFFDLPLASKLAVDKANSFCNRGYEHLRGQTLEPGALPDLKEGYYCGNELPMDDPRVVARKFNHGPNQWPQLDGFRESMEPYIAHMMRLSRLLMQGLALSLELDENYFGQFCSDAMATLRLLHYPPQPANPDPAEKGCGAHTDFGGITLLAQDRIGGLQVWDTQLGWIHAPPLPGTFVVNLGDMIARWTNDRYRSTLHRVVNLSGRERYSIPYFFSGNPDHVVTCLPTCLEPHAAPKYPPTTVGAHLAQMYRRTYAA